MLRLLKESAEIQPSLSNNVICISYSYFTIRSYAGFLLYILTYSTKIILMDIIIMMANTTNNDQLLIISTLC